jgi:hypothetical protein
VTVIGPLVNVALYFQRKYFGGDVEAGDVISPGDVCPTEVKLPRREMTGPPWTPL